MSSKTIEFNPVEFKLADSEDASLFVEGSRLASEDQATREKALAEFGEAFEQIVGDAPDANVVNGIPTDDNGEAEFKADYDYVITARTSGKFADKHVILLMAIPTVEALLNHSEKGQDFVRGAIQSMFMRKIGASTTAALSAGSIELFPATTGAWLAGRTSDGSARSASKGYLKLFNSVSAQIAKGLNDSKLRSQLQKPLQKADIRGMLESLQYLTGVLTGQRAVDAPDVIALSDKLFKATASAMLDKAASVNAEWSDARKAFDNAVANGQEVDPDKEPAASAPYPTDNNGNVTEESLAAYFKPLTDWHANRAQVVEDAEIVELTDIDFDL